MTQLRIVSRLLIFFACVLTIIPIALIGRLFLRSSKRKRNFSRGLSHFYARIIVWSMNIQITTVNMPPRRLPKTHARVNYLFVGNHTGMIDTIIFAAVRGILFITSVEMKETPLLGQICEAAGCLFVERRSRMQIEGEKNAIRDALSEGQNIVLFPEGTSTNGESVLPFKRTLMMSVVGTSARLTPFVINYRRVNGEPMSSKWRDHVFWYGDLPFLPSMFRLFALRSLEVELTFFPFIPVEHEGQRREVAEQAHSIVKSNFTPVF